MSTTNDMRANALLAIPRKLLDDYLREAADKLARRREIVGTRIREAREEAGLKQKQLAARVHVEPQTVSNWERSVSIPDLDKVELLAEILERPVGWFYSQADTVTPDPLAAEAGDIHDLRVLVDALLRREGLDPDQILRDSRLVPEEPEQASEGLEPPAAAQPAA